MPILTLCGRVTIKTTLVGLMASSARIARTATASMIWHPRFNGSPGQDYPIMIRERDVAGPVFLRANWGLMPRWAGAGSRVKVAATK